MPSLAHRQTLVAATGVLFVLFLIPNQAESVQENWVDQIAQRVRAEQHLASREPLSSGYERYLTQLHSVQQALLQGDVHAVQKEMSHFVRMVGTKEGGISESTAQSLLLYINEVTPVEYLDETTKSHLRLVREMVTLRAEAIEEPPTDSAYSSTVTPETAPWGAWQFGWISKGTFRPIITVGMGVLVLVAVGVVVLLFVAVGAATTNGRSAVHTKDRTVEGLEKKTQPSGSSRDAA
ncbi:MAG: hypothetical protein KJS98_00165 [Nitrospirae bacterium]|nr:hypothetical protein [Nitrospirota bacterium]